MYTTSWHRTWAATLLVVAATLVVPTSARAQATTFHANGATAEAHFCSTTVCLQASISRGQSAGEEETFLLYDLTIFGSSTDEGTHFFGFGEVPNNTFQVSGPQASFAVNTALPEFTNIACTFDSTGQTCNNGTGGLVTATLNAVPINAFHSSGINSTTEFGVVETVAGTSDTTTATGNLSVLGTATNADGNIGVFHNTTITVTRQ